MSVSKVAPEGASVRGSLRFALGAVIALPTTTAFVALSVMVVLGRSIASLGARTLARVAIGGGE